MTQIIGLTGYAQHGKDSVGRVLIEEFGFTRFAFADALKSMALALNPFIVEDWNEGGVLVRRLLEAVETDGWDEAKKQPEVRRFLQALGTEGAREHLGDNVWVDAVALAIEKSGVDKVVLTDTRFPNEADFIKSQGGTLWRVVRLNADGTEYDNGIGKEHPSEAFIAKLQADLNLTASNLLDLNAQVIDAMTEGARV